MPVIDLQVALWLILAVALFIIEGSTLNLVTIWFALGALCAAATAGLGFDLHWQISGFVTIAVLLLVFTKPLAEKVLSVRKEPTNADRILGKEAVVIVDIEPMKASGQIKVLGADWSAESAEQIFIPAGEKVVVQKVSGVKAVVSKVL